MADELTRRLRRIEGQIRGLQRMVEEDQECELVLTQLIAARAALDRVGLLVLDRFVERCLADGASSLVQHRLTHVLEMILSRYSVPGANNDTADFVRDD